MGLVSAFCKLKRKRQSTYERSADRFLKGKSLRLEPLEDRRMLAVLMVDADAEAGGNGQAWGSAYNDLQNALTEAAVVNADADDTNDVDAIWIAEGTYKPTALLESGDARSASFSLLDGVTLFGGFAGNETTLDDRDWSTHVTMVSGDLGTLDDSTDNAYTVVYCGENIEAVIDGVWIYDGNADGAFDLSHPYRRQGGGIYTCGTLTVANSTLTGNSAVGAGGAYVQTGSLTVMNSTISDNSASANGGGIHNHNNGVLSITDSIISGNSADYSGGGIDNDGTLTVTNSTLSENSAASGGGGICGSKFGTLSVTNSTLTDNSATYGAGIYCESTLIVTNSSLFGNSATNRGGGIYSNINSSNGALTVAGSELSNNSAAQGAGIYNRNNGTLAVTSSAFSGNSATNSGGGIYDDYDYDGTLSVTNSTLTGNSATYGGGIYSQHMLTVTNSTLSSNSATHGGGIYNTIRLTVTNCTFMDNSAIDGAGIYNRNTLAVANSTLSGNSAANAGGAVFSGDHQLTTTVTNTIVAGNQAPSGPDIYLESGILSGSHSLIGDGSGQSTLLDGVAGNQVGTSTLPIDPMLSDWFILGNGQRGYRLSAGSPAINMGNNDLLPTDTFDLDNDGDTSEVLPTDLAGNHRVIGGLVDIGACEFVAEQFVTTGHLPQREFLPGQEEMTLFFSRELTTLTAEDLTLVGPYGEVPITGVSRTRNEGGWSEYSVRFAPIAKAGDYQLVVMPTVRDEEGGFPDQDFDDTPGELEDDRYVATWTLAGPMVESYSPKGTMPAFSPLGNFDIVFNRAIDPNSFSLNDIQTLAGPDGEVMLTGHEWLGDRTLRVAFEPISATGTISIALGTGIRDQWGNQLDQNQNAVVGEIDDGWSGAVTRSMSGTIDQDMVISSNAGVVVIDGTVTIAPEVTLTIEAGVTLKFGSGAELTVGGQLVALGTVDQPVVFTSSAISPGYDAWPGIRVTSTGIVDLSHAEVRYAVKAVDANSDGSHVVLKSTTLRDGGFGVYVYSPYAEVTAKNCLIANNANTGVFVRADSRHSFTNCTIVGNGFGDSGWHGAGIHLGGAMLALENCIVAFNNTAGLHHEGDPPTALIRNSVFHNPAGQEISWNGDPGMPDLTADGNMTLDPLFVDRHTGNYRLADGSSAIDSGTGIHAPTVDLAGGSRYDDQGMPNLGTGYPSFVDVGAYERQEDSPMYDLAVTDVSVIADLVTIGDTFELKWTVHNTGTVDITGAWHDLVYLSDDPYLGNDQLLTTVEHSIPLGAGTSYTETFAATVPATSGPKYILVHTQLVESDQREAVETNNLGVSAHVVPVDVPILELGTPIVATATQGQWDYYRFEAEPGGTVHFTLDGEAGSTALYLRQTLPPTFSSHDVTGTLASQSDDELRLLRPVAGTYYVGVFQSSLSGGSGLYSLSADQVVLGIREVTPTVVGNAGTATIEILGDNFSSDAEVQLIAPDGTVIEGEEYYQDAATLFATFDLASAVALAGDYDVVVDIPGPEVVTRHDVVAVREGGQGDFFADVTVPGLARPGRIIEVGITYDNSGLVDISNPILEVEGVHGILEWQLPGREKWIVGSEINLTHLSSAGPPDVLRPGQSESMIVRARLTFDPGGYHIAVSSIPAESLAEIHNPEALDALEGDVRPTPDLVYSLRDLGQFYFDDLLGLPTGIVAGQVLDGSGVPLEGVEVVAANSNSDGYAEGLTDQHGRFILYGLRSGEVGMAVRQHLVVAPDTLVLPEGEDAITTEIVVSEAGHIVGRVIDVDTGLGLSDARIVVQGHLSDFFADPRF